MRDLALVVDDGCGAGVGGADHRAAELQRTHTRNLQVLVNRDRIAKPGDVADIDKDGRGERRIDEARAQLFAEKVFVADVGRQPLALPFERSLPDRAAVEVAQRDVHHVNEPPETWRY